MTEAEMALRCRIQGLEIVRDVFLNAPLNRAQFRGRFSEILDRLRQQNAHDETIAVVRGVLASLVD